MKLTAIEWLMQNVYIDPSPELLKKFEQAKELEKQQIVYAWVDGNESELMARKKMAAEQYFENTFKK